jgi:hypothetical protein
MPLYGDTNYDMSTSALNEAWDAITDPPGQALEAEGNRLPWAAVATAIGIGHALLALSDELRSRS